MRRSRNRVLDAALSGLLVGLLAVGPAFAQQSPQRLMPATLPAAAAPKLTVLVVPLDAAAQTQVPRLTYLAEQSVTGTGRFQLVRLIDALDPQGASIRQSKAEEAAAAFQEGQQAYDELDTQKALQQFDKAAQTYESSDLSLHFANMSRARVMKIASYVANGDNKGFLRELKEVLARNPYAEFSSNYFPQDELAVVEKTRKAILADANRTLQVRTGDVSAQVFVDGQFRGTSPVTISGLTSSEHFVTIIAPGYLPAQSKTRGEVSYTLKPLPTEPRLRAVMDRITENPGGEDRDAAIRELGVLAGTQQVLALLVRGSPVAGAQDAIAIRLDVSDGHNLGYATAPVPSLGEAMDPGIQSLLSSVLQADAPRDDGPVSHFTSSKARSGRQTAGYVLLATGAALVAGGLYFGLEASSKSDRFKKTPQTDPRAEKLSSDGKTFALIADLGIIAGLASAGAGSWLAFRKEGGGRKAPVQPARPVSPPAPAPLSDTSPSPSPTPPEDKPVAAPQDNPAPPSREEEKRSREQEKRAREEEAKRAREEEAKRAREEEEKRKREEEAKRQEEERLAREKEEKRKREEEARRKREEEAKRKREEEEKKKRRPLDEDDLRNY